MSFKKFWNCCFPEKKEQLVSNNEESYDIKNSPQYDKIEYVASQNKIESINLKSSNEKSGDIKFRSIRNDNTLKSIKSNIANADNKKQIENSFTSFGGIKNRTSVISDNFISNDLQMNSKDNEITNDSMRKNENSITQDSIKVNNSPITTEIKTKKVDGSNVEIVNSQRKITDEEVKNAPILLLEEIKGDILKNNKLKINAAGLASGLRKARDGVAFFGKSKKQNQEYVMNDFELNLDKKLEFGLHIFIIYYKKENNSYYLKGYSDKQSVCQLQIMIDNISEFPIMKKEVIILNENYFQVLPLAEGKLEIIHLGMNNEPSSSTKEKDRQQQTSKYFFHANDNKSVTIGRDKKCDISFPEDKSFSKIHTSFIYDFENKIWKLKDGYLDKPSTNGTWIYATHSYEIVDNMIFHIGDSKLRLSIFG